MSSFRMNILVEISSFKKGLALSMYLGVPIFKGKPKVVHLHPITDKFINMTVS